MNILLYSHAFTIVTGKHKHCLSSLPQAICPWRTQQQLGVTGGWATHPYIQLLSHVARTCCCQCWLLSSSASHECSAFALYRTLLTLCLCLCRVRNNVWYNKKAIIINYYYRLCRGNNYSDRIIITISSCIILYMRAYIMLYQPIEVSLACDDQGVQYDSMCTY